MPDDKRRRRAHLWAVGVAAGAAALAAVYVTARGDVESGGACAAAIAAAERLKPLSTGALGGLIVAEMPRDLSTLAIEKPDGTPGTLADFRGTPLLVNFWATWCAPCRAEMPALDRLAGRLGAGVRVVAINIDVGGGDKAGRFLGELGVTSLVDRRDPKMRAFSEIKAAGLAYGLPASLIVDADGCQVASLAGAADWDGTDAGALTAAFEAGQ